MRWWYAIDWPTEKDIGNIFFYIIPTRNSWRIIYFTSEGVPPAGYESLDGFKGVFISTRVKFNIYIYVSSSTNKHACMYLCMYVCKR